MNLYSLILFIGNQNTLNINQSIDKQQYLFKYGELAQKTRVLFVTHFPESLKNYRTNKLGESTANS